MKDDIEMKKAKYLWLILLAGGLAGCNASAGPVILVPEPQKIEWKKTADFRYPATVSVCGTGEDAIAAAKVLQGELQDYFGLAVKVTENQDSEIVLRQDAGVCGGRAESYTLSVSPEKVVITGRDRQGLIWGCMTLLQLSQKKETDRNIYAVCCEVEDWPTLAERGYFFELSANNAWGGKQSFEWLKRCIRRLNAYYKGNLVGLGEAGAGCFPLKRYPFIQWDRALSAEQIRELIAEARKYGMEPYPVVEVFGHAEGLFLKHTQEDTKDLETTVVNGREIFTFAELDKNGKFGNAICMSHPQTREVVKDVFDSVYELFDKPHYFHIGMDEATPLGTCPRCKDKELAQQFADYLTWCRDYLKEKGVENIVLWADELLDHQQWPRGTANSNLQGTRGFGEMKGGEANTVTHPAVDMIPKDLLLVYWHYSGNEMRPVRFLQEKGFNVWGASWNNAKDAYKICRSLAEQGASGVINTTWTFSYWRGAASLASAEAAWSPEKPMRDFNRVERMHMDLLPPRPSEFAGTESRPLALPNGLNRGNICGKAKFPQELKVGKVKYRLNDSILAAGGAEAQKHYGVPAETVLPVNEKCRGIAFLHGGIGYSSNGEKFLGTMTVRYADGPTIEVPLWNGRQLDGVQINKNVTGLVKDAKGWTSDARPVAMKPLLFHSWEWSNPCPEKEVREISWKMDEKCSKEVYALLGASLIITTSPTKERSFVHKVKR